MRLDGDPEVRRRAFLTATLSSVGALLTDRLPSRDLLLDGEPLAEIGGAITALRILDRRDGAASVLMPTTFLADRLNEALATTPPKHEEYLALAALAADAGRLAGWVSFENGENGPALRRYDQTIRAARQARDPDLAAFAAQARATVLWRGLGDTGAALAQLKAVELGPVSQQVRCLIHGIRGQVLAAKRDEAPTHRAMEAATEAAHSSNGDSPSWLGWCGSPADVDAAHGLALANLGYGDKASEHLASAMRQLPARMRRLAGTLHRGLAQAAVLTGEPDRAAKHVLKAHEIFVVTKSRQLGELRAVVADLQDRYGDVREVQDLKEHLRTKTRYVTTRSMRGWQKVHQRSCHTLHRGQAPHAEAWPDGNGSKPADVVALVAARPAEARPRLEVCRTCIVGR
jgi:hypothetical protein